jgi:hypothetical protein
MCFVSTAIYETARINSSLALLDGILIRNYSEFRILFKVAAHGNS